MARARPSRIDFREFDHALDGAVGCLDCIAHAESIIQDKGLVHFFQELNGLCCQRTSDAVWDRLSGGSRVTFKRWKGACYHQLAFDMAREFREQLERIIPVRVDGRRSLTWDDPTVFSALRSCIQEFNDGIDPKELENLIRSEFERATTHSAPKAAPQRSTRKKVGTDSDLARVADAWPTLPDSTKAEILALVASADLSNMNFLGDHEQDTTSPRD